MAVKLSSVQAGDVLFYPLAGRPGEYYEIHVKSVDHEKGTAVISLNGREHVARQTNFNRYRRSRPHR